MPSRSARGSSKIIGPRYREDLCLDAAAAIEERVGIVTPIDAAWAADFTRGGKPWTAPICSCR